MKRRRNLNLLLDEAVLRQIDSFVEQNAFPSRTEAIRWLLRFGLDQIRSSLVAARKRLLARKTDEDVTMGRIEDR